MAEDVQRIAKAITPSSAGKDISKCTRVIREGPAIWSGRKENEAVHLFLLNNILLLTEAPVDEKYKLIYMIKLKAEFRVPEVADPVTWRLITPKKEFDFVCSSPEDKSEWFRCIRYTMEGTVPPVFVNGVWDPLGALLPDELAKFQELKARVQAVVEERSYDDAIRNWLTDHTYLRFLKARNWVVEDAFKQLDDTLKWRDEFKPLSITIQDVDREAESGKFIVTDAKDKLGRPIVYFKTALDKTPFDDVRLKHMVFLLEEIALRADASRYATEKSVWFFDFTDRDFKSNQIQPAIKCSIDFIKTFQAYYPETLGKVFLINSPAVFQLIWKGVKGFIDPITQGKVNFYKKSELQETMEDFFDVDNLDEQFGGRLKIEWNYEEWKRTLRHGNTGATSSATSSSSSEAAATTTTSSETTEAPAE